MGSYIEHSLTPPAPALQAGYSGDAHVSESEGAGLDAFSYLAVFVSIILGLGVTRLLGGVADLARSRARVDLYWPTFVWMFTLFVLHLQIWWSLFALRAVAHWTFAAFALTALRPAALFLATSFIVPDVSGERIDMRQTYFRESRWFFASLIVGLACARAAVLVISGLAERPAVLVAQLFFIAACAVGMLTRNDLVHKLIGVSAAVLYSLYVGLLFASLA